MPINGTAMHDGDNNSSDDDGNSDNENIEDAKKETIISILLICAKNKFISRGLEGSISITRQCHFANTSDSMRCHVTNDMTTEYIDTAELGTLDKKCVTVMGKMLRSLEERSKCWDSKSDYASIELTRSVVLSFHMPFIFPEKFNITIEFTVSLLSMIIFRSRKRKIEMIREMEKSVSTYFVQELQLQGIPYSLAVASVYNTNNSSIEEALQWAIVHPEENENGSHNL